MEYYLTCSQDNTAGKSHHVSYANPLPPFEKQKGYISFPKTKNYSLHNMFKIKLSQILFTLFLYWLLMFDQSYLKVWGTFVQLFRSVQP